MIGWLYKRPKKILHTKLFTKRKTINGMPPKVEMEFVRKLAESFTKGQPYAKRISLTLFRNQVHERLKDFHYHQIDQQE